MAPQPSQPIKLYRFALSGHSHRAELLLSLLGLPTQRIEVALRQGAHKQPDFLALNAFGQVPVIDDAGTIVADSNAILVYLALKYGGDRWLPTNPQGAAEVQRWLSVAAGPIASGVAAARLITVFGAKQDPEPVIARAHGVLRVMNEELSRRDFLVENSVTIADVACYTYTAHAPEGNVSLADYPQLRAWLARIEGLSGFVPMQKTAVGLSRA